MITAEEARRTSTLNSMDRETTLMLYDIDRRIRQAANESDNYLHLEAKDFLEGVDVPLVENYLKNKGYKVSVEPIPSTRSFEMTINW